MTAAPMSVIWIVDIIGSSLMIILSLYAVKVMGEIHREKRDITLYYYLYAQAAALAFFALSRSVGHIAKRILITGGQPELWQALSPISGSINTITFVVFGLSALLYSNVRATSNRVDALERKEAAVRKSETRYRDLYDNAPDMYHSLDKNGIITGCNETWVRATGYEKKEIIGRPLTDFFSDDSKRRFERSFPKLDQEKTQLNREREYIRKDGSTFLASLNVFSEFDSNGNLVGTKTISRDVTELTLALWALEEGEDRYRIVTELTSDYSYAYRVEPTGEIELHWIAGALTKITGFTRKELSSRGGWESLIYPEDMQIPMGQLKDLREGKSKTVEYRIVTKNGEVRWMMDYAKPEWDEREKRVVQIHGAVQDITERKRAKDALQKAYEDLKSIDELKSNLIANVTHELRTPLTIVMSSLELAKAEEDIKNINELLDTALEAMMRQNIIVGDLIEASQIERGICGLDLKSTELKKIISNTSSEFIPVVKQQGIKMNVLVQKDLPRVKANQKQLEHILRNLISNAIKFNKKGGKISIDAKKKGKFVEASVADTGVGITKEALPKVFDRFYQADSSTSRAYGGTGMGLSVVKEIVEAHGGNIGVESKPGEGSRFYFTVPIYKKEVL